MLLSKERLLESIGLHLFSSCLTGCSLYWKPLCSLLALIFLWYFSRLDWFSLLHFLQIRSTTTKHKNPAATAISTPTFEKSSVLDSASIFSRGVFSFLVLEDLRGPDNLLLDYLAVIFSLVSLPSLVLSRLSPQTDLSQVLGWSFMSEGSNGFPGRFLSRSSGCSLPFEVSAQMASPFQGLIFCAMTPNNNTTISTVLTIAHTEYNFESYIQMQSIIIQPLALASGISLLLMAHNSQLSISSYLAPIPYWIGLGRPLGLAWNNKVLKPLNKDVFPAEMKNYRQLYLVSRRALVYDILFNHCLFHPLQTAIIIGYTYATRFAESKAVEESRKNRSMWELVKKEGLMLLQIRALVSMTSILSEYWLSYFMLRKSPEGLRVPVGARRMLLLKQMLLNMAWYSWLLKRVHENYFIDTQQ